jgi:hypothetical protein
VVGHTKFSPDRLFAATGKGYRVADVVNLDQLASVVNRCAVRVEVVGVSQMQLWKNSIGSSELSNLRVGGIRAARRIKYAMTTEGVRITVWATNAAEGAPLDSWIAATRSTRSLRPALLLTPKGLQRNSLTYSAHSTSLCLARTTCPS